MTYLIGVRVADKRAQTFSISAKDETEAKARLALRLPPQERDKIIIDSIKVDPKSIVSNEDPYGVFGGE
jgi:hypothetical protein